MTHDEALTLAIDVLVAKASQVSYRDWRYSSRLMTAVVTLDEIREGAKK